MNEMSPACVEKKWNIDEFSNSGHVPEVVPTE